MMNHIKAVLQHLFGDGAVAMAGAMGGLVRWMTMKSHWIDGVISIVVGALCAIYISPLALPILGPIAGMLTKNVVQQATFSGFIVGVGGIGIAGWIMDMIEARRKAHANPKPPVKPRDDSAK